MKSLEQELLCAAKATTTISNQAHPHNHNSLVSHQNQSLCCRMRSYQNELCFLFVGPT